MGVKKNYEPKFKAKIALEAIKNLKGTAEICSEYKISATNSYDWRDRILGNSYQIFIPEAEHVKKQKLDRQEIESLHKMIGEITIENNFLKKKLLK
jgi:transposase